MERGGGGGGEVEENHAMLKITVRQMPGEQIRPCLGDTGECLWGSRCVCVVGGEGSGWYAVLEKIVSS